MKSNILNTKIAGLTLAFFSVCALAPQLAYAEEGGLGPNLLIPNLGEFVPMLIVFLIVWAILAKYAWPMIIGTLDEREKVIKDNIESAETAKIEAQRLVDEYELQLSDAREQVQEILDKARLDGEEIRKQAALDAKKDADDIIREAHTAIERQKIEAAQDLQTAVADISIMVSSKVIGEELSDEEKHRQLIEKYLAEVGSSDVN